MIKPKEDKHQKCLRLIFGSIALMAGIASAIYAFFFKDISNIVDLAMPVVLIVAGASMIMGKWPILKS